MMDELPDDILHLIVHKLSSLVCYATFRSVCRTWRSYSLKYYSYLVVPQPPWLMFPNFIPSRVYDLYTFDGTKQFFQFEIPDDCECGWNSGTWLFCFDHNKKKIRVWNPFSSIHIVLPYMDNQLEAMLLTYKFIISCTGPLIKNSKDVVFGIIYGIEKLAILRLGDKCWTRVEVDFLHQLPIRPLSTATKNSFDDIVFYQGKLYAINQLGRVFVCEEAAPAPCHYDYHRLNPAKAIMLIDNSYALQELDPRCIEIKQYLVEVDGNLMHVIRSINLDSHPRLIFRILKLDFIKRKSYYVTNLDLKGHSLFLSKYSCSSSAKVSETSIVYLTYVEGNGEAEDTRTSYKLVALDYFKEKQDFSILFEADNCELGSQPPSWIIP